MFPLGPSPVYSVTAQQPALPSPREYLRLRPLLRNTCYQTPPPQKKAQMKEQIKTPEKIQLSDEEIANPSDAQFKTLVIKMLTELVDENQMKK